MELQLSSGRVVEIKRPSVKDRIRCGDIKSVKFEVKGMADDGTAILGNAETFNTYKAGFAYAAAGLGVDEEALDEYTDAEVLEIGKRVVGLANLNPTKEPS